MKLKNKFVVLLFILVIISVYREFPDLFISQDFTGSAIVDPVSDVGDFQVYFCPRDDCSSHLLNVISSTQDSVYCAFFDLCHIFALYLSAASNVSFNF